MKTALILFFILSISYAGNLSAQQYAPAHPIITFNQAKLHQINLKKAGIAQYKTANLMELTMYYVYQTQLDKTELDKAQSLLNHLKRRKVFFSHRANQLKVSILEAVVSSKKGDSAAADDKLQKIIDTTHQNKLPELAAWANYELADNNWPKRTRAILESAFAQAGKGNNKYLKVIIGYELAKSQNNTGYPERAQQVIDECEADLKRIKIADMGRIYAIRAAVAIRLRNNTEGLKWALLSVSYYTGKKDTSNIADAYFSAGRAYRVLEKIEEALPYLFKALASYEAQKNTYQITYTAELISGCYQAQRKLQLAIDNLTYYTNKYPPINTANKFRIARMFLTLYTATGDAQQANFYKSQLDAPIYAPYANDLIMAFTDYYFKFKDYEMAKKYLEKRIREKRVPSSLVYRRLYTIDSIEGNYKNAFYNLKRYVKYTDSIRGTDRQLLIKQFSYDFNIKEKNYAIALKDAELRLRKKDFEALNQHASMLSKDAKLKATQLQSAKLKEQKNSVELQLKDQNITFLHRQSTAQQKTLSLQMTIRNIVIIAIILCLVVIYLLIKQYQAKQRSAKLLADQNTTLEQLVNEKSWLLKEMHHRVKNNLQIVISLLNSQYSILDSESAMAAIQESQYRMHSISLIHQKLYQSENLHSIDMKEYIHELVNYLVEGFDTRKRIQITQNIPPLGIDVAQAVPIGLIINEAITNSIKYAFSGEQKGEIHISLEEIDHQRLSLMIADNGKGLPQGFDIRKNGSLGMNLIRGLSKQLSGDLQLTNNHGLTIHMHFKRNQPILVSEKLQEKN